MAIRMTKPWLPLTAVQVNDLGGYNGVYQLGTDEGEIALIGVAGGRSLFGLRGELLDVLAAPPPGVTQFRVEVNTQYTTRSEELLMVHFADHGRYPKLNPPASTRHLGRLSPA